MKIDKHYSQLQYQPIDFINKYNFNYTIGNFVKYISRYYTIDRADINKQAQNERLKFYLKNTLQNMHDWNIKFSRKETERYCDINEFTSHQLNYLLIYFNSIKEKDYHAIYILLQEVDLHF